MLNQLDYTTTAGCTRLHNYCWSERCFIAAIRTVISQALGRTNQHFLYEVIPAGISATDRVIAVESIQTIALLLVRNSRANINIAAISEASLTNDELRLMSIFSAARNSHEDLLHMQLEWFFSDQDSTSIFTSYLLEFLSIDVFRHYAPSEQPLHWSLSVSRTDDLCKSEFDIVTEIRVWVVEYMEGTRDIHWAAADMFGNERNRLLLARIMKITATHARRNIDVRCMCCGEFLSDDEMKLLDAIACAQHGIGSITNILLLDMLPYSAITLMRQSIDTLADSLTNFGARLPLRAWLTRI